MRLAVLKEAKYQSQRKGNLFWYLETFFIHQPDAYDESGTKYYIVKEPYQVFLDGKVVEAVELDTYVRGQGYGAHPTSLHAWTHIGTGSRKMEKNYLYTFGDDVEIKETRTVDLPKWVGSSG